MLVKKAGRDVIFMQITQLEQTLNQGGYEKTFSYLYGDKAGSQKERYLSAIKSFHHIYAQNEEIELYSAPGRTEVCGNHTDHQHGRVMAAGVDLDVIAVASKNLENIIRIQSEGYPLDEIDLSDLSVKESEKNTAAALIRGVAAKFQDLGVRIGGFNAYTTSNVLKGSGLSSSAAFEVLVGVILNDLWGDGKLDSVQIAQIGQYAENVYFGKPSGLMDQTASAVGGFVAIDFQDPGSPVVEQVKVDFAASGYKLCIVDTGGSHADLTGDYATIPEEMGAVAAVFGKKVLREVDPNEFYKNLAKVRETCSDRAILRAFHFFADNNRVPEEQKALERKDYRSFLELVIESGHSSYMYLQNVYPCGTPQEQGLSLALAVSERVLKGQGAWRVHGGGFAGTIQCFVPEALLESYQAAIEAVFGAGTCHILSIRPVGGIHVTENLI